MGRLATIFGHYYQPDANPAVARMIAEDWWDALRDLPQAAVDTACRGWIRHGPPRRPTPSEIREMAVKADEAARYDAMLKLAPPPPPPEPERVPCPPEARARILASAGMTERRINAIQTGRAMPRAGTTSHDEIEVAPPPPTVEQIVARPYTDEERTRMALNPHRRTPEPPPPPPEDWRERMEDA